MPIDTNPKVYTISDLETGLPINPLGSKYNVVAIGQQTNLYRPFTLTFTNVYMHD